MAVIPFVLRLPSLLLVVVVLQVSGVFADGGGLFTEDERRFWSFQPNSDPELPTVETKTWARSPVDRFILARLEAEGIVPAPAADTESLLRRVTFDLTGLPPTPEEIEDFSTDASPDAFSRVVDRLLASPHYGERWGRRWLDVVRFGESTGISGSIAMPYAYRYRDYVTRSFNEDQPYDEFVVEQLAGDLLPTSTDLEEAVQRIIATGFLMLGPKALAEPDKEKTVLDIVDEQIDVTGRAFLGLTISCARCHDHKFDPIPTLDYYSLAGIFYSTQTMGDLNVVSKWQEYTLTNVPGQTEPLTVMAAKDGKAVNLRVHIRGDHHNLGEEAPRRFLQIIAGEDHSPLSTQQSGRLEFSRWIASSDNPLTARVMVNRIWQGHFGTGLVATGDDFGAMGERPSHPDLLDWLSSRFIDQAWSIKAMHRLMLSSSTYQMRSSHHDARGEQRDPDNRLLWKATRRRLEAEELRDAVLSISDRLDRRIGGTILDFQHRYLDAVVDKERELYGLNLGGKTYQPYYSSRRSLYLPIIRQTLPELLQVFNAADSTTVTSKRGETTTAPQALFLINNSFVREHSLQFSRRLVEATPNFEDRVQFAYLSVFGRLPDSEDVTIAGDYLEKYTAAQSSAGRSSKVGFSNGTTLTLTLERAHHGYRSMSPEIRAILDSPPALRLLFSVTSVDRPWDNNASQVEEWETLDVVRVMSAKGSALTVQSDHSVLVDGKSPSPDTYTIVGDTDLTGITAVRLQVLPEDPATNSARLMEDLFVLSEISLDAAPKDAPGSSRAIVLQSATAPLQSKEGFSLSTVIDGDRSTSWPIGPRAKRPGVAVFETENPTLAPWRSLCRALFCSNEFLYVE